MSNRNPGPNKPAKSFKPSASHTMSKPVVLLREQGSNVATTHAPTLRLAGDAADAPRAAGWSPKRPRRAEDTAPVLDSIPFALQSLEQAEKKMHNLRLLLGDTTESDGPRAA